MPKKKQVIGNDGQLKTVVRSDRSRKDRIQQHMHGRSDNIRAGNNEVRYVVYALIAVPVLGFLLLILWLAIR